MYMAVGVLVALMFPVRPAADTPSLLACQTPVQGEARRDHLTIFTNTAITCPHLSD